MTLIFGDLYYAWSFTCLTRTYQIKHLSNCFPTKKVWKTNSLTPRQERTSTLWDHSPMLCHLCHHPTPFWWKRLEFIEKLKKETSTIFEDPFQDEKMFFKKTKFPQTIRISKNCNNLKEKNESVRWKIIKIKSIIGIYHWKYPMSNSASMYVSTAYSS